MSEAVGALVGKQTVMLLHGSNARDWNLDDTPKDTKYNDITENGDLVSTPRRGCAKTLYGASMNHLD